MTISMDDELADLFDDGEAERLRESPEAIRDLLRGKSRDIVKDGTATECRSTLSLRVQLSYSSRALACSHASRPS